MRTHHSVRLRGGEENTVREIACQSTVAADRSIGEQKVATAVELQSWRDARSKKVCSRRLTCVHCGGKTKVPPTP
jgi:hypothetical protein